MDSLKAALTSVKDLLDWLPDLVVALLILAIAVLFALALHRWARKLFRRAIAGRYPFVFSVFTQTRGLTKAALLILAMMLAVPVAPLPPETAALLARGLDPFAAACAAVIAHARAGQEAARRLGAAESVIATDVIAAIPAGLRSAGPVE